MSEEVVPHFPAQKRKPDLPGPRFLVPLRGQYDRDPAVRVRHGLDVDLRDALFFSIPSLLCDDYLFQQGIIPYLLYIATP